MQWLGTAEPSAAGTGADVPGAREGSGPLESEDPVAALASGVGAGVSRFPAHNAVRGGLLAVLVEGGLVAGEAAAGLLSGWTPAGLLDRFEGSGLRLRVDAVSDEPLPRGLLAAVEARRAAGLPTDEAALRASSWSVRVDAPAFGGFSEPDPGPAIPWRPGPPGGG